MSNPRMIIGGFVAGVLAFAGMFAFVFLGLGPTAAAPPAGSAAPAAPAIQAAAATATPVPANAAGKNQDYYGNLLTQNLATRLGVDRAKLDAAFSAAMQDTVDQAVRDGKLTQDQAGKVRDFAASGLAGLLGSSLNGEQYGSRLDSADADAIVGAVGQLFGMTADQLREAVHGGQTLDTLEQSHHVTAQQVNDAALHTIRTQLDQGVQSGKWSQAEADKMYQGYSDEIDNVLLKMTGALAKTGGSGPAGDFGPAVEGAIAKLFGMSADEFAAALKSGQTLAALEQAHTVDHAQVRAAALAAAQTMINQGLQSGKWTQAQVDAQVGNVGDFVDRILTKLGGPAPAAGGATQ
jgi:hypothetical protein